VSNGKDTSDKNTLEKSSERKGEQEKKPADDDGLEILKDIPPEAAKRVVEIIGMSARIGPTPNPLLGKLTTAHIDKILEISDKADEREFLNTKGLSE